MAISQKRICIYVLHNTYCTDPDKKRAALLCLSSGLDRQTYSIFIQRTFYVNRLEDKVDESKLNYVSELNLLVYHSVVLSLFSRSLLFIDSTGSIIRSTYLAV